MALQVQRNASRYLFFWLAVVYLISLTSAKTITSYLDDEAKRKESVNVTAQEDSDSENRALNLVLPDHLMQVFKPSLQETVLQDLQRYERLIPSLTVANQLIYKLKSIKPDQLFSSKEFNDWAIDAFRYSGMKKLMRALTFQFKETNLRKMANEHKKVSGNNYWARQQLLFWMGDGQAGDSFIFSKMLKLDENGDNILTDPSLLQTWVEFVVEHGVQDAYKLLFELLTKKLIEQHLVAEYLVIASIYHSNTELQNQATLLRRDMVTGWKRDDKTLDQVYALLRLDEKPGPLKRFALHMWIDYARLTKVLYPEKLLFPKLQEFYTNKADLGRAVIAAMKTQTEPLADILQQRLLEKWRANKTSPNNVEKLLKLEDSKDPAIQRAEFEALRLYRSEWEGKMTKAKQRDTV